MKKCKLLLLFISILCCSFPGISQRSSIGFHGTITEYLGDLNPNKTDVFNFKFVRPGGGISLQQYLGKSFNLMEMAVYNQLRYQTNDKQQGVSATFGTFNALLKYKTNNGYILKEDALIAPYLIGGGGVTHIQSNVFTNDQRGPKITDGDFVANLAFGAGGYLRLSDLVGLEYTALYNIPMQDKWDGEVGRKNDWFLQHTGGIVFNFKKQKDTDNDGVPDKKDKCPNTPPNVQVDKDGCPIDTDKDGVADYLDKCPNDVGSAALNGCPDTDKDGVADVDDKCPTVPGLAKFAGCPDTDKDGVEDSKDKCPNTPEGTPVDENGCPMDSDKDKVADNLDKCPNTPEGVAVDANGCPLDADKDGVPDYMDKCPNTPTNAPVDENGCPKDTDKDGMPDYLDRCPNMPAPGTANGCPEVKAEVKKFLQFATRGIFFDFGKATLKPESYKTLDEVVKVINDYPDYNLRLGGHTDNVGSDDSNYKLSQARVDAVKTYIVGKGVPDSRIQATGYGESKPIASNKTAAGRAKNRRVEMDLYLK